MVFQMKIDHIGFWLLLATCCNFVLGNSTIQYSYPHPYLSISIRYPNEVLCHATCQQSPNCEPKMKVLAQTSLNMTEESSNKVTILGEGKFFALCFLNSEEESSPFWIKKSFLSQKVGNKESEFEIFEIGNRRMISEDSLNPRIEIESFGLKNETFSVNCSISLPTRENQNVKLLRVSPAGVHTEFPLNALRLSAAYSGDASSLTIEYKHQFLFTEQYVNDTFKCVAMDVATGKYRTAVSQKIRAGEKCSGQLKIRETSSFYVEGDSSRLERISLQWECSCPGSQPEPEIFWKTPSGELLSGPSFIENETLSTGNYCCVAVQNFRQGAVKSQGCFSKHKSYPPVSSSCKMIKKNSPNAGSGVYTLNIRGERMKVFCDMESNDQQWIVIQRRLNGTQPFDKSWSEYKNGFGDLNGEFWLGNEKLHQLTSGGSMKIRFDLWDKNDTPGFAEYSEFSVSGESDNYRLTISGYSGNAADSMSYHNQMQFSTKDRDNDQRSRGSCSNRQGYGGWWYNSCATVNLNGKYLTPGDNSGIGPYWYKWKGTESMKKIIIKISYK